LRRPTTKISRAVCAIGGSHHGCVGHKYAHRTVVPIFVVQAAEKRSPFWTRIASPRAETEHCQSKGNLLPSIGR
jgi:hypothetical protein